MEELKYGPPVIDFDYLRPVTMTIMVSYDIQEMNIPAIFSLLPVCQTSLAETCHLRKKQGKIQLPPELNKPGEIISMRWGGYVRGIVRSKKSAGFPHSIIMDIGTSDRIISLKLSKTIELTGPRSLEIAREATEAILTKLKACSEKLQFIQEHRDLALALKPSYLDGTLKDRPLTEDEMTIISILDQFSRGCDKALPEFLDFWINFNRPIYIGTLNIHNYSYEMANLSFNLGYPVNQVAIARIMEAEPFICQFTNAKTASGVTIQYQYIKYDRNTGQPKVGQHTIRVNKSGHVRYSGPGLEAMRPVYYTFLQRILQHQEEIRSCEERTQQIKINTRPRIYSPEEWRHLIEEQNNLRERILSGQVPLAQVETLQPENEIYPEEVDPEGVQIVHLDYPTIEFDYIPIVLPQPVRG